MLDRGAIDEQVEVVGRQTKFQEISQQELHVWVLPYEILLLQVRSNHLKTLLRCEQAHVPVLATKLQRLSRPIRHFSAQEGPFHMPLAINIDPQGCWRNEDLLHLLQRRMQPTRQVNGNMNSHEHYPAFLGFDRPFTMRLTVCTFSGNGFLTNLPNF